MTWLKNLLDIKQEKNMSTAKLAELSNLPEKTVRRVLTGETHNPYLDTLDRLATALGVTIGDILAGTRAVITDETNAELQAIIEALTDENNKLKASELALLLELEKLKAEMHHKDEMLEMHKEYMKLLSKK